MDGAPGTHAELWAPIHGADGQPIASLELTTGDIDCSGSLDDTRRQVEALAKLLEAPPLDQPLGMPPRIEDDNTGGEGH